MNELKKILVKPLLLSLATVVFAALVATCGSPTKDVKHYVLTGKVLDVAKNDQALVVNMDAIPGYMDAMQMSVHVKDAADLDKLSRGDSIRGDLVVHANGSWLQDVSVTAKAK